MRKNLRIIILIIVIVLQLCVPAGMIAYKTAETNTIIENGELFKFKIDSMDYNDGKLEIDIDTFDDWGNLYAEVQTSITGYAELILTETKPQGSIYIKSSDKYEFDFPVDVIKTDKFSNLDHIYLFQKKGDEKWWDYALSYREIYNIAYLEAYVYEGKVVPVGVYINGVKANTYLSRMNEEKQ